VSADSRDALVSPSRRRTVLLGALLGLSIAALDQMILSSAAPAISAELGGLARTPWLFTAYLLTTSCTMPIWGGLGDRYGRRRVFLVAVGVSLTAALLAAQSRSMGELVLARALHGLGAGGLLTLPNAIIADVVPQRMRAAYYAFGSGVWAIAGLLGPLIGGLMVDGPGWRFIFYSYVPFGLIGAALITAAYPAREARISQSIDLPGAALLVATVGALLLFCSGLGLEFELISAPAAGLAAAFAVGLAAFVWRERRAREPLLPIPLLRLRGVPPVLITSFVFGLGNFATGVFIPLFAVTVAGASATDAGMRLVPMTAGIFLASMAVGRRIAVTGRYRHFPPIGLALYSAGIWLQTTLRADTPPAVAHAFTLFAGLGAGMINPIVVYAMQHVVPREALGLATALPPFCRTIGQSVGTAVLGAVLVNRLDAHLAALAPESGLRAESLQASPAEIHALGGPLETAVTEAFRLALGDVFGAMAVFFAIAFLVSLRLRDPEPESLPPRA
jgi:EmrB/QacA subfamily drug resistance transporter